MGLWGHAGTRRRRSAAGRNLTEPGSHLGGPQPSCVPNICTGAPSGCRPRLFGGLPGTVSAFAMASLGSCAKRPELAELPVCVCCGGWGTPALQVGKLRPGAALEAAGTRLSAHTQVQAPRISRRLDAGPARWACVAGSGATPRSPPHLAKPRTRRGGPAAPHTRAGPGAEVQGPGRPPRLPLTAARGSWAPLAAAPLPPASAIPRGPERASSLQPPPARGPRSHRPQPGHPCTHPSTPARRPTSPARRRGHHPRPAAATVTPRPARFAAPPRSPRSPAALGPAAPIGRARPLRKQPSALGMGVALVQGRGLEAETQRRLADALERGGA